MPTRPAAWGAAPRTPGATPSAATEPPTSARSVLAVAVLAMTATAPPTPPASGGGPSVTDWLSVSVAALALAVAVVVGFYQVRLQQQVTRIEQERRERERQKERSAQLMVVWQPRRDQHTGPELLLSNTGEAAASAITIDITSADDGRLAPLFESGTGRTTVDRLAPGPERQLPIRDFPGAADNVTITLSWTDDRGAHQESTVLRTE